jgi:hypothetical protein
MDKEKLLAAIIVLAAFFITVAVAINVVARLAMLIVIWHYLPHGQLLPELAFWYVAINSVLGSVRHTLTVLGDRDRKNEALARRVEALAARLEGAA